VARSLSAKNRPISALSGALRRPWQRHDALPRQSSRVERSMQHSLDEVLSRVIRESGSWSAAERRIRIEHGAAVVHLATQIALRERGQPWLAGERPHWSAAGRG
jgi:hypothetical protein